jgi:hypothetical protein
MIKVHEEQIRNEHVRRMFYNIPHVSNMIAAHQLAYIGKTVRGPLDRPAQQMLTACCDHIMSDKSAILSYTIRTIS